MHRLVKQLFELVPDDMSVEAFCRYNGINPNTFRTWRRKANPVTPQVRVLDDILQKMGYRLEIVKKDAAGEPSASPQINTATESCGGIPPFFKDILRKLEFSAQQSEIWENPEDISMAAIQYRALAVKLERWMDRQNALS